MPTRPEKPTPERILDAAEELFAERGFGATSLRRITEHAEVNLAAVHYHFRSKEGLIEHVFERRVSGLNLERLRLLDALEREASADGPIDLEAIVEAFVGPALRMSRQPGGSLFTRLFGHTLSHPDDRIFRMLTEQFRTVFERFTAALRRALPQLDAEEVTWRLLFSVGSMAHTMAVSHKMPEFSHGAFKLRSADELIARMVPFLAAGMRADAARRSR